MNPLARTALASALFVASCSQGLPSGVGSGGGSSSSGASSLPPSAAFDANATHGVAPLAVQFTQSDAARTTDWTWNFGDGTTCAGSTMAGGLTSTCADGPITPTHVYATPGVYTVTLTARGPGGTRVEQRDDLVEVLPAPPLAAFEVHGATTAIIPFTVHFENQSTHASDFVWSFGDGSPTTTEASPAHTYTSFGTFDVSLTARGVGGTATDVEPALIHAQAPPPDATFQIAVSGGSFGSTVSGAVPLAVQFRQSNSAFTTGWQWDFNGDSVTDSTAQSPTFTYTSPGVFSARLRASGPGGFTTSTLSNAVEAFLPISNGSFEAQAGGSTPGAGWTQNSGNAGGASGNLIRPFGAPASDLGFPTAAANWCEISSASTNNVAPPTSTTASSGGAGITQSFSYRGNARTLRFEPRFLTPEPATGSFVDWMSVEISTGGTTRTVFLARSSESLTTVTSGIHGTLRASPIQTISADLGLLFPSSTTSTVFTLAARIGNGGDGGGTSFGYLDNVRLETGNGVVASFNVSPRDANVSQSIAFTDTSTNGPTSWLWTFGDGATSTQQSTTHAFATAGTKTVRLAASNATSSDFHDDSAIRVFGVPNASFTASTNVGTGPLTVVFTNTSSNVPGVVYDWSFGEGTTINGETAPLTHTITFTNSGSTDLVRTVRLTARTPTSPAQTNGATRTITIHHGSLFSTDIAPVLQSSTCHSCHTSTCLNVDFGSSTSTLRSMLIDNRPLCADWDNSHAIARYVVAFDPANSYLLRRLSAALPASTLSCAESSGSALCDDRRMPPGGDPQTVLANALENWILNGCGDN